MQKTFFLKQKDIDKKWLLVNAENAILGRLASRLCLILRGKDKSTYTPHLNCGNYIIVTNVEKIALTGKKFENKISYSHSGFPGGLKCVNAKSIISSKHPERLLKEAIKGMLPRGPLAAHQLKNIKFCIGEKHKHTAQNPVEIFLDKMNYKKKNA